MTERIGEESDCQEGGEKEIPDEEQNHELLSIGTFGAE